MLGQRGLALALLSFTLVNFYPGLCHAGMISDPTSCSLQDTSPNSPGHWHLASGPGADPRLLLLGSRDTQRCYSKMFGILVMTRTVQQSVTDDVLGFAINSGRIVACLTHAVIQKVPQPAAVT